MKRIFIACLMTISSVVFAADIAVTDNPFGVVHGQSAPTAPAHTTKHTQTKHHRAANDRHYGGDGDHYTNVSGHRIHRPVRASSRPAGATGHCRDGSWSFSEHRRGMCSRHGGIGG